MKYILIIADDEEAGVKPVEEDIFKKLPSYTIEGSHTLRLDLKEEQLNELFSDETLLDKEEVSSIDAILRLK